MSKRTTGRLDENGLPRDAREWTEADWSDLHRAMETVKRLIATRHAGEVETAPETVCPHCRGTGVSPLGRAYRKTWEKIKNRAWSFSPALLAREWGVPATRLTNQLAALERHGLLVSSPVGRERLYRVREGVTNG